jgi:hypothetical protein
MDLQSPSVFMGNVYWAGHSPAIPPRPPIPAVAWPGTAAKDDGFLPAVVGLLTALRCACQPSRSEGPLMCGHVPHKPAPKSQPLQRLRIRMESKDVAAGAAR